MPTESKKPTIDAAQLARLRERAAAARAEYAHKPGISELLTPEELADGAPFYFELQACVMQLKNAREAAGLTLAQVAEKTGLATETLCRLETGQVTNPTWKTLGLYAAAVGRKLSLNTDTTLTAQKSTRQSKEPSMMKNGLRLNEVRVLLALKCSTRSLTIDEIATATAFDTPSGKGVSTSTVSQALDGVAKSETRHEATGYPGLIARGYVKKDGDRYQITLPDPHPGPGPGSRERDDDEE